AYRLSLTIVFDGMPARKLRFAGDSPLEERGFELVWGLSCQVVVFGLLPVLCSEVCPGKASMFSRRQSCRGKSQSPVVRMVLSRSVLEFDGAVSGRMEDTGSG